MNNKTDILIMAAFKVVVMAICATCIVICRQTIGKMDVDQAYIIPAVAAGALAMACFTFSLKITEDIIKNLSKGH